MSSLHVEVPIIAPTRIQFKFL